MPHWLFFLLNDLLIVAVSTAIAVPLVLLIWRPRRRG
jgi:hypothetical protein